MPSSPFAIGSTLCSAFLLDYYFTFKGDAQRGANATLALRLAENVTWRYLQCWAMDSDRSDGAIDSAFMVEPNSGRDWAALGCANEVNWNIDALTQVYVHSGDARMRYYLRGLLQRWPALYRPIYQASLAQYGSDSLTEGFGVFDGAGPGRGGRYDYGFTEQLPFNEPIGASTLRIIAGDRAAIAFNKGGTSRDIADYRSVGNGNCSFRIVAGPGTFDVSFSYPFVDISGSYRHPAAKPAIVNSLRQPPSASAAVPQFLLFPPASEQRHHHDRQRFHERSNHSALNALWPMMNRPSGRLTNGLFVSLALPGNYPLSAGLDRPALLCRAGPGLHWVLGIPYQQRLSAATNPVAAAAPGAYVVTVAFSPPEGQTLTWHRCSCWMMAHVWPLSGHPAPAWRAWPLLFNRVVLLDYAVLPLWTLPPAGRPGRHLGHGCHRVPWELKAPGCPIQQALTNSAAAFAAGGARAPVVARLASPVCPVARR